MSKKSKRSESDSERESVASRRASRLSAILCPTLCALTFVCVFAFAYLGAKMARDQYDAFCNRRFDVAKLYVLPNVTHK